MSYKRTHLSRLNLLVVVLSAVFCLAVLGAIGYMISVNSQPVQTAAEPFSLMVEGNAKTGTLNQDPEVRQKELNSAMEEGMLVFPINAAPLMENKRATANPLAENPPENTMRFIIIVRGDDSGEMIYQSDYLDPEQYIDDAPLGVEVPKGKYPCTAYFDAYQINNNVYVRRAGAQITLYVLE